MRRKKAPPVNAGRAWVAEVIVKVRIPGYQYYTGGIIGVGFRADDTPVAGVTSYLLIAFAYDNTHPT